MSESTTIVAFDQHAATTVAAVLLPGHRTPAVHVPTEQEEAARDLLRCCEDIRADLLRTRHRLSPASSPALSGPR